MDKEKKIQEALERLKPVLGKRVSTDMAHRQSYTRDWSPRMHSQDDLPDMVAIPTTTEECVEVVKVALDLEIPICSFAGGTGMGGGVNAWKGGIMIDTKGMDKILEFDKENMAVRVQAGMTIWHLNEFLKPHGLWLPHQPESKQASTIGAAIGCDNDSTFGVKYGKILECLTSLKAVTGRGEAVEFGHRKANMTSTGYKLMHLFVASEGTLGVVTEATLRLNFLPKARSVMGFYVKSIVGAAFACEELMTSGVQLESLHINNRQRLHFYTHSYRVKYNREPDVPEWADAIMFVSVAGDQDMVDFSSAKIRDKFRDIGMEVKESEIVTGYWASKHTLDFEPFKQKWPDSQRERKFGAADVGVPIGNLGKMHDAFCHLSEKYEQKILGMTIYNECPQKVSPSISFAIFVDDHDQKNVDNFYAFVKEMSITALELEGTMSTYIGDGDRLGGFNALEHGASYQYMKDLKNMFDPKNIMNPGKKFESRWIR